MDLQGAVHAIAMTLYAHREKDTHPSRRSHVLLIIPLRVATGRFRCCRGSAGLAGRARRQRAAGGVVLLLLLPLLLLLRSPRAGAFSATAAADRCTAAPAAWRGGAGGRGCRRQRCIGRAIFRGTWIDHQRAPRDRSPTRPRPCSSVAAAVALCSSRSSGAAAAAAVRGRRRPGRCGCIVCGWHLDGVRERDHAAAAALPWRPAGRGGGAGRSASRRARRGGAAALPRSGSSGLRGSRGSSWRRERIRCGRPPPAAAGRVTLLHARALAVRLVTGLAVGCYGGSAAGTGVLLLSSSSAFLLLLREPNLVLRGVSVFLAFPLLPGVLTRGIRK